MRRAALGLAACAILLLLARVTDRSGLVLVNEPRLDEFPVRGIDVSHHQGGIDWSQVADAGIQFAYIKATEGRDLRDPEFQVNWRAAAAAGIARGAYHFFTFCSSGREQAEHFLQVVPPLAGTLIPVADVEFVGNCRSWSSLSTVRAELLVFLQHVERVWGARPIIYTTSDAYERVLGDQFTSYSLWLRSVDTRPPFDAFGGWLMWQFSETGSIRGINGPVDLNTLRPGATLNHLSSVHPAVGDPY